MKMFGKFVSFWINKGKLTLIFMLMIVFVGVFSWIMIPKQYNPDIVVPAFNIVVPAPGFDSQQVSNLIVKPLENKIYEIEGVEHVYGISSNDYGALMVTFFVGTDKEKATTRIYNKILGNIDQKPLGVGQPIIKSIDPDDIPVYTFGVYNESLTGDDLKISLRKIGQDLIDQLKFVPSTSQFYIVGGQKDNINIKLDLAKMQAYNIDYMQVYDVMNKNNLSFPGGDLDLNDTKSIISIDGNLNDVDKVNHLLISYIDGKPIFLGDVANVYKGISKEKYETLIDTKNIRSDAVFIGIAKKRGKNAVQVVDAIKSKIEEIKLQLPKGYKIIEIQNEGETAKEATNTLLEELFKSIGVLFIVLFIFLGFKDAFSSSLAIPLVLSITFGIGLLIGDNINRITLFALILVLGMLVDDSIIVVENISRHLSMRYKEGKDIINSIIDAVSEIGVAAVFSTLTKIMAFFGMFFVTGMMGQYMGPIPKYAIIALTTSVFIAFAINPFISYFFAKRSKDSSKEHAHNNNFIDRWYLDFMKKILSETASSTRKNIKKIFWISLMLIIILPIAFGIFKARMLPKSNKEQIYLWLDLPRNYSFQKTKKVVDDVSAFLKSQSHIESISSSAGVSAVPDFSNVFRGGMNRDGQNYISMRINLDKISQRKITSEQLVIDLRPKLKSFVSSNFPDAKIRLLEDPPGPPVRSTLLLKISSKEDDYQRLADFTDKIFLSLKDTFKSNDVVDYYKSYDTYQTEYQIKIDHEALSRLGLDVRQVSSVVYGMMEGMDINIYHDENTKEPINVFMTLDDSKNTIDIFDRMTFTSNNGKKIYLKEFAKIIPTQTSTNIYSDDRQKTIYIYGEMGNNSVVYPMVDIINILGSSEFWRGKYDIVSSSLYGISIKDKSTGEEYEINYGGEWEVTMDTFRDLGGALIITLFGLYVMVSVWFQNFKIGGNIMLSFLFGMFGIMPGYTLLYLLNNEYFSATSMIGVIALAGIVVGNAIIMLEYFFVLHDGGESKKLSLIKAGTTRLRPIALTSITAILGAAMIIGDPVWSGLAWSIIFGLSVSAILTLILLPVFVYDNVEE